MAQYLPPSLQIIHSHVRITCTKEIIFKDDLLMWVFFFFWTCTERRETAHRQSLAAPDSASQKEQEDGESLKEASQGTEARRKGQRGAESSGYKRRSANHHILRNHTWQMPSSVTAESLSAHMKVCAAHPSCTSQTCLRLFSLYFTSQPFLCFRTILRSLCFLLRGNRASADSRASPCLWLQWTVCETLMNLSSHLQNGWDNSVCDLSWCGKMQECGYPVWSMFLRSTRYYS